MSDPVVMSTWTHRDEVYEVEARMIRATGRYGDYASTHEAYGVLAEECAELLDAIRANRLDLVRVEALDVAAVALRLAEHCRTNEAFRAQAERAVAYHRT